MNALTAVAILLTISIGLFAFGSRAKERLLPEAEPGVLKAVTPTNKWLSLLNQPLEKVACLKGEVTDFSQQDKSQETLSLRSDRNLWILAAAQSGRPPFRVRGRVLMDEGAGSVGFMWGLSDDANAFPKKQRQCFVLLIQRFTSMEAPVLTLQHLTIGEFLQNVPWLENGVPTWVNGYTELARTPFGDPMNELMSLEIAVDGVSIEVFANGKSVWRPKIVDQKKRDALAESDGLLGFVGHGRSVIFRDAAVKYLTPTRKDN